MLWDGVGSSSRCCGMVGDGVREVCAHARVDVGTCGVGGSEKGDRQDIKAWV